VIWIQNLDQFFLSSKTTVTAIYLVYEQSNRVCVLIACVPFNVFIMPNIVAVMHSLNCFVYIYLYNFNRFITTK